MPENFTVAGNPCASVSKFVADPYPPEARLPVRVLILSTVLLASIASAQAPAPNHQILPFTGRVVDADSHKPIPGARIHYLDDNPPIDRNGNPVRGIVSGDLSSAQDGGFTLPADLPLATYEVTVTAPGYYAGTIYDSQEFIGEKLPSGFVHPSHVFQLRRSHDLVAIGASEINGAKNDHDSVTDMKGAFEPLGKTLVIAGKGPGLWKIDLNTREVRRIELPDVIHSADIAIIAVAWDGANLIFECYQEGVKPRAWIGAASAPDFRVTVVSAPNPAGTAVSITRRNWSAERYRIERNSSCDEDASSPHCGQSAILTARDSKTRRTITIKEAMVSQLSYLFEPEFGGIVVFSEDTPNTDPNWRIKGSGAQFVPGLTLLNLSAGTRTHAQLPSTSSQDVTFLAQQTVRSGKDPEMRIAYAIEGDCDPASTQKAQPYEPSGSSGVTPNNWSVCVMTAPMPAEPPPSLRTSPARAKPSTRKY